MGAQHGADLQGYLHHLGEGEDGWVKRGGGVRREKERGGDEVGEEGRDNK